ncbi:hypothetical protein Tco_0624628 [Tanacetum coccineum]|uniref:Uncharacterized protein n=1 Tax=Tanacetum coccineum TaxID=301880 RepID=A0ABQ4WEG7_9ASTR
MEGNDISLLVYCSDCSRGLFLFVFPLIILMTVLCRTRLACSGSLTSLLLCLPIRLVLRFCLPELLFWLCAIYWVTDANCNTPILINIVAEANLEYYFIVISSGWSFVSVVSSQMTYPVASLTLDSARSYVMQGAPFTQGTISSIPIGDSISPEGFLPPIVLLVVIIVTVVIVTVILVVVVVAIVGVVIVIAIIRVVVVFGGVSFIIKLLFVITCSVQVILLAQSIPTGRAYAFHQDKASSVRVPVANVTLFSLVHLLRENTDLLPVFATGVPVGLVFLLGLLVLAIVVACASRVAVTLSATSFLMAA